MKKNLFLLLNTFLFNSFAAVATQDIYVMNKDTQSASNAMSMAISVIQEGQKAQKAYQSSSDIVSTINNFRSLDLQKFCPSCSDYTIQQLQDWRDKNAKNLCENINNQLDLVSGHMTSAFDISNLLNKMQNINPSDLNAMQSLNTAFASASSQTLTEMNQTQQQLAAYNLQKDQKENVEAKITEMKLNKSMFGQANICSTDSTSSSCN